MTSLIEIAVHNRLLAALSAPSLQVLIRHSELIELSRGQMLYGLNEPIHQVYFPTRGLVSLLISDSKNSWFEIASVGKEGMLGNTAVLGIASPPFLAKVYLPGNALCISISAFVKELAVNPTLQEELNRYLLISIKNLGQRIFCMNYHSIEERLARWLLVANDTSTLPLIPITHHCLSNLLGVRRGSITHAANSLQQQKLIWYHRGNILVLNKAGLEKTSCTCYRQEKDIYNTFIKAADTVD